MILKHKTLNRNKTTRRMNKTYIQFVKLLLHNLQFKKNTFFNVNYEQFAALTGNHLNIFGS